MQIGVFGNSDSWYVSELCRVGQARGHHMWPLLFPRFVARIGETVALRCGDVALSSLDVVLVRTMPPGSLEQVVSRMDLLGCLEAQGVTVLNPPRSLECAVDKYLTTQRLALAGIPVPSTVVCETSDDAMLAFEQLGGDVVVKPLFGAEGRGILRASDPELALRCFRTLERLGAVLYLQEFIAGPAVDLRLLLLDGQLIGAMQRFARPGDFRANMAQQGTAVPHRATAAELQLARQAADVTGAVFAGVDLMYDEGGCPVVIEVNAVPGWRGCQRTCQVDVAGAVFDWLEGRRPDDRLSSRQNL